MRLTPLHLYLLLGTIGSFAFAILTPPFQVPDEVAHYYRAESIASGGVPTSSRDFVFTTCGSVCPMMSAHLRDLQKTTPAAVRLVSFTVDPDHDTPAVLKEYAQRYQADEQRWHFLTGTTTQMYQVAREMRLVVIPPTQSEGLLHDEHFMLIDGDGNVRGVYDSKEEAKRAVGAARAAGFHDAYVRYVSAG